MKILLIDDHKMIAESLKLSLEKDNRIDLVNILNSIKNLENIIINNEYDIILMDINLSSFSEVNGLELAENLIKKYPNLNVVMLTGYDNIGFEAESKAIGAKGFISKDEKIDQLINKLDIICCGNKIFKTDSNIPLLTKQEKEIINMYSSGLNRKEVAQNIGVSTSTLAVYLNKIYDKLEVKNYQEMVAKAISLGYVDHKNLFKKQ